MNIFQKIKTALGLAPNTPPFAEKTKSGLIIAAEVTKIDKHPNADRLVVVSLHDGQKTIEPIVCGAKNFTVGDIVVLALPGAEIKQNIHSDTHESFILEKAKIRGVESQGMICAEFELGESSEAGDGIKILPPDTNPGTILY